MKIILYCSETWPESATKPPDYEITFKDGCIPPNLHNASDCPANFPTLDTLPREKVSTCNHLCVLSKGWQPQILIQNYMRTSSLTQWADNHFSSACTRHTCFFHTDALHLGVRQRRKSGEYRHSTKRMQRIFGEQNVYIVQNFAYIHVERITLSAVQSQHKEKFCIQTTR